MALKIFLAFVTVFLVFNSETLASDYNEIEDKNFLLNYFGVTLSEEKSENKTSHENDLHTKNHSSEFPRSLLKENDEYVERHQRLCLETRNMVPCIQYKASKLIWRWATNGLPFFSKQSSRNIKDEKKFHLEFIELTEPSDIGIFSDARSSEGL